MAQTANSRQIGGSHYKQEGGGEEHWDRAYRLKLDYFQARITAYVERCWKKNGLQDLEKAQHFLEKYIELERAKLMSAQLEHESHDADNRYVHQDREC